MSSLPALQRRPLFPYGKWGGTLPQLAKQYLENSPFPHICLTDFLEPEIAHAVAEEFPAANTDSWTQYKHANENKMGMPQRAMFPPQLGEVTDELNSPEFVAWLSALTGIPNLVSDPDLEGGGLHQSGRGGFLNVHTDFSMHHYHKNWHRRVNLILYLNVGWQEQWGGAIEFWDLKRGFCAAKYAPHFNHAVIFTTDDRSFHGFPDPLECPENVSRKSLALYYYTVEASDRGARSTDYRARPGDGLKKAALIWLDKQAVNLYSRAKVRFGFSDELASRLLGFLSRKK